MYHGDIALEGTIDIKFTTRRFTTGVPFTLAGTPVISAYVGNSVTQITAGITLSADFDGVTGLNNVRVVAAAADGYAAGTNVALVITTGTVDSVSVVGEVVGSFSISHRPVQGLAANVITATAINNDAITDAKVAADVTIASVTGAVGSVTGAVGSVTGLTASDVGAIKTQTDKFVFTVANQVNANIQYVNDVAVAGDGSTGNEWGPV